MSRQSQESAQAFCLLLLVGIYGFPLLDEATRMFHRSKTQAAERIKSNNALIFQRASGVDVFGETVYEDSAQSTRRSLVFLLRNESLPSDLHFWRDVASELQDSPAFRLVGYCDDPACALAIREGSPLTFPVLQYGEIASSEALINADEKGFSILLGRSSRPPIEVLWRSTNVTPSTFSKEVIK